MTIADGLNNHSDLIEKLRLSVAIFTFCLISMCMDNGKLAGLISIGDIVKAQHHQLTVENHYLKNYIQS